jgi:hypothetical protein
MIRKKEKEKVWFYERKPSRFISRPKAPTSFDSEIFQKSISLFLTLNGRTDFL